MPSSNSQNEVSQKYSRDVIAIHWISVCLIFALFPLGKYMAVLEAEEKMGLIRLHGIVGVLIFTLTIARSVLFFTKKRPPHLETGSTFNDILAVRIHQSFYVLLLLLGTSGIATMILGGYVDALTAAPPAPDLILPRTEIMPLEFHSTLAVILMILVFMHIAGVIRFNIKHKTNALKRIS